MPQVIKHQAQVWMGEFQTVARPYHKPPASKHDTELSTPKGFIKLCSFSGLVKGTHLSL